MSSLYLLKFFYLSTICLELKLVFILNALLFLLYFNLQINLESVDTSMKLPTKFNYLAVLEAKVVTNTIPLSGYVIGIHHYRKI